MKPDARINELSIVREYFSHNLRTSTAMVVATVSIFKFGISDDTDSMADMIIESSYYLDVYDKGMEVLFNYILGKPIRNDKETFDPVKIASRVIEDLHSTIKEQNINISYSFEDMGVFKTNNYVAKTLLELVLCEEIKKCVADIVISSKNNTLSIKKNCDTDNPEIYKIFARFFAELGIEFTYTNNTITLRFA